MKNINQSTIQYLSDKFKEAKSLGFAWLTYRGQRLKVSTNDPSVDLPVKAFIKSKKRKIALELIVDKDGFRVYDSRRKIQWSDILAIVVEEHYRLDKRLGIGLGAARERSRLNAQIKAAHESKKK